MKIISKYFSHLSERQIEQFSKIKDLYKYWNDKINVISRKDIDLVYEHHVLHSLSIARLFKFRINSSILDVGTGGGFPGIPLAIYYPGSRFVMVESVGKKVKVVNSVISELGLDNAEIIQTRIEDFFEKFNFVTGRAVTPFTEFADLVRKNIIIPADKNENGGIIYLKGGDCTEELNTYKNKITIFNIKNFYNEDYFKSKKIVYLIL